MSDIIKIDKEDFGILAISAIRYCQGRETYMPRLVRGILRSYLEDLSDKDLQIMINDCKDQELMGNYGDPWIDKPGWIRWKNALLEEKESRKER